MNNKARKASAVAAIVATATLSLTAPAFAHDQLVSVTPEKDAQLATAPQEIVLEFSGNIMEMDGANQVRVVDAEGNTVSDGEPKIEGKTVTEKLVSDDSENDTYTVTYRVVSSDGHPIQDSFEYTVGTGAQAAETTATDDQKNTQVVSGQTVGFTPANIAIFAGAAVLVIGAVAVIAVKARRR